MAGNDIVIDDPLVSRHHAVIRWTHDGYELEDLGAANGTHVQGHRIHGSVLLSPGQAIRVGGTELVFHVPSEAAEAQRLQSAAPENPAARDVAAPRANASRPLADRDRAQRGPGSTVGHYAATPASMLPLSTVLDTALPAVSQHTYFEALVQQPESGLARILRTEGRKSYWRVFSLGLVAYFAVSLVLMHTGNLHLVPLQMLLASVLVPVVFVIFCWEQNAFADMPPAVVGVTFISGASLGLTIAAVVEPLLLPLASHRAVGNIGLTTALLVGLCEETAKVVSVAWFLRDRRIRSELDGLILGAAAGMGFAALETAGYGFVAFLSGFGDAVNTPGATMQLAISAGIHEMNVQLLLRMGLAIFGHGVWTAIVCAAIWRDRGQATFRLTPGVAAAFAAAVGLHALWDWSPMTALLPSETSSSVAVLATLVLQVGWYVVIGMVGLFLLRFFLRESLRRAKLGPLAPPPEPVFQALVADTFGSPAGAGSDAAFGFVAPQASGIRGRAPALATARRRTAHCGRCGVSYSPDTPACPRCGGPLIPLG
jgi:RsiW-degrading membrane proteinase PrsW (M82 family)